MVSGLQSYSIKLASFGGFNPNEGGVLIAGVFPNSSLTNYTVTFPNVNTGVLIMHAPRLLRHMLIALLFAIGSTQVCVAAALEEKCDPLGFAPLIEYYHPALDHYFYTDPCAQGELQFVDSGGAGAGWRRTGWSFGVKSYYLASHYGSLMWRFYGSVSPGPNSHFFTSNRDEMEMLRQLEKSTSSDQPRWNYESSAFGVYSLVYPSDPTYKPCYQVSTNRIIRRFYNQGFENQRDPNHRFVAEAATEVIADMKSRGWKDEGAVFCVRGAWLNGVEK